MLHYDLGFTTNSISRTNDWCLETFTEKDGFMNVGECERKIVYTLLTFPFKGFNKCNQVIKATNLCGTSTKLAFKIKTLTDVPS